MKRFVLPLAVAGGVLALSVAGAPAAKADGTQVSIQFGSGYASGPVVYARHHGRGGYYKHRFSRHDARRALRQHGYRRIDFVGSHKGWYIANAVGGAGNLVRLQVNSRNLRVKRIRILEYGYAPPSHRGYGRGHHRWYDRQGYGRGHYRWKGGPGYGRSHRSSYLSEAVLLDHARRGGYGRFDGFTFQDGRYCGHGYDRRGNRVRLELDPYSGRILVAARIH